MILPQDKDVFVYQSPIDMRKSFDGLFKLVRQHGIFDGGLFLFVSKNRKRAKIIFWDGSGLIILMKRMEYGRFADIWRRHSLSLNELGQFLSGSQTIARSSMIPLKSDLKTCIPFQKQANSLHEEIRT
jgi:transposase